MMNRFGRPSLTKDLIGIAIVSIAMFLLWAESTLAAGGSAVVGP